MIRISLIRSSSLPWRNNQYRDLFALVIRDWRQVWNQGDFPFYWVQLANYRQREDEPSESNLAQLREAQTMILAHPNTGQALAIDVGGHLHPQDKQTVANRLASIALAETYVMDIPFETPRFQSMEIIENTVILTFDAVGAGGLYAFGGDNEIRGFSIAGDDRNFVWAEAKIIEKNKVEVWSDLVAEPVAIRYAWADNPDCNLYSRVKNNVIGLPVTPFRTDD